MIIHLNSNSMDETMFFCLKQFVHFLNDLASVDAMFKIVDTMIRIGVIIIEYYDLFRGSKHYIRNNI